MPRHIIPMPPVGYTVTMVTTDQPRSISYTADQHSPIITPMGPARRRVEITVSALSRARDGDGLVESLKHLLNGGESFLRLTLPPQNWWLDRKNGLHNRPLTEAERANGVLGWTAHGQEVSWTAGGEDLTHLLRTPRPGVAVTWQGRPAMQIIGLPHNRLICRASDVIRVYGGEESLGASEAINTVRSDAEGRALILLRSALPSGAVSIGDEISAVFRAEEIGDGAQPIGANWTRALKLTEALPPEYAGATDLDPWSIGFEDAD